MYIDNEGKSDSGASSGGGKSGGTSTHVNALNFDFDFFVVSATPFQVALRLPGRLASRVATP
jgi:hypothetical protein